MNNKKHIGIYKITSPNNNIYIGQSINILSRFYVYQNMRCKSQTMLYNSLKEYGVENHKFEIIYVLDTLNLDKNEICNKLNQLEKKYISLFNSFIDNNKNGLNLTTGGGNSIVSEESKRKNSESHKGLNNFNYGKKRPIEIVLKISDKNRGKKRSEESKKNISESKKGISQSIETIKLRVKSNTGKKRTQEFKDRMSEIKMGEKNHNYNKKLSIESILKRSLLQKGIKRSEEFKKNLSELRKGNKNPMFGKKISPDIIAKAIENKRIIRQERLTMIF